MFPSGQPPSEAITQLLGKAAAGDRLALLSLTPLVYAEMRAMAATYMRRERPDHSLRPTDLVHEAYVRMLGNGGDFPTEAHFKAVAGVAMRNVLVDHARRRGAQKRHPGGQRVSLPDADAGSSDGDMQLLELDELMDKLAELNERCGQVVGMRVFGGMTHEQIAEVLGISRTTVADDWSVARAWLAARLRPGAAGRRMPEVRT